MRTKKLIATMLCMSLFIALVAYLLVPQPAGLYACVARDAEFTFVVFDQESGKPIPGVAIQFFQEVWPFFDEAREEPKPGLEVTTDGDGKAVFFKQAASGED